MAKVEWQLQELFGEYSFHKAAVESEEDGDKNVGNTMLGKSLIWQ